MAFLEDSYRTTLESKVTRCEAEKGSFRVFLEDTVFFPEGGGQPNDVGTINEAVVSNVITDKDGNIAHIVDRPLEVGSVAVCKIDFARRFDHMQCHTSQHVISAIAEDLFGWRTMCWGLGSKEVTVDLTIEASKLESGQIEKLEQAVNNEIRRNHRVSVRTLPREEAFALPELRESAKCVPDTATSLRLVGIDTLDLNPCCGTHVNSLAELQLVKFYATESARGGTRLFFRGGGRVLAGLASSIYLEKQLSLSLSCGPSDFVSKVDKFSTDLRATTKESNNYKDELGALLGAQLAASADRGVAYLHRPDGGMKFISAIADGAALANKETTVLITSEGAFLLAGPEQVVKARGAAVAALLGGKGGGKGKFQGKYSSLDQVPAALDLLRTPAA